MCLTLGSSSDIVVSKAPVRFRTTSALTGKCDKADLDLGSTARLAQSAERKALNLVVVGSSPTVGALLIVDFAHRAVSAVGFASIPSCLQWILSPPLDHSGK